MTNIKTIDIDFIKQWVNISEEELMMRLVKDALSLQNEAKENQRLADIAKRKTDPEYNITFIKQYFRGYKKLKDYFSDDQILEACQNNMSKRDLTKEEMVKGHLEKCGYGRILRYEPRAIFKEYRNEWEREITAEGTVILIASPYQVNADKVVRELLLTAFPWLSDYDVSIYKIEYYMENPLIFIKTPKSMNIDYGTDNLYVPISALFDHDPNAVVKYHSEHWHNYGNGKYDANIQTFLATDHVRSILKHIM